MTDPCSLLGDDALIDGIVRVANSDSVKKKVSPQVGYHSMLDTSAVRRVLYSVCLLKNELDAYQRGRQEQ